MQFSRGKKYCLGIISCSVAYLDFIKEGRGAVGVNGGGRVAHPLPGNNFCPQGDKFECILMQFLTGRKHGQSVEVLGHGFYGSIAKRSLQKQCKNYPKIHGQTKGGVAQSPLNTPLVMFMSRNFPSYKRMYYLNRRRPLTNEMKGNGCRPKKTTFSTPLARSLGRSPPY